MARTIGMGTAHRSAAAPLVTYTARSVIRRQDRRRSPRPVAMVPEADAVRRIERSEPGGDVHGAVLQPERYRLQLGSWIKVISAFWSTSRHHLSIVSRMSEGIA